MAYTLNTAEYFHGATNGEIDFFYYGSTLKKHSIQFHNDLKLHLWDIKKGEVADYDFPSNAIAISSESFITFVVRHMDEVLPLPSRFL